MAPPFRKNTRFSKNRMMVIKSRYHWFVFANSTYLYGNLKHSNMKNRILIIALLFIGSVTMAQTNDTTTYEYCEVVSISKNMSAVASYDANVFIDFGGGQIFSADAAMKDDKGVSLTFNSQIDCLNYLAKKGWKVGQTNVFYQGTGMRDRSITRYTLSRPKYGLKK